MINITMDSCAQYAYDIVKVINTVENYYYYIHPYYNLLCCTLDPIKKIPIYSVTLPFQLNEYRGLAACDFNERHHIIFSIADTLYYVNINIEYSFSLNNIRVIGQGTYPYIFLRKNNVPNYIHHDFAILFLNTIHEWQLLLTNNFLAFYLKTDISSYKQWYVYENSDLTIEKFIFMQQKGAHVLNSEKSYLETQCNV